MKLLLILAQWALLISIASAYTKTGNVYFTDGSYSDVNSAVTAASDGEIIDIPEGTFQWDSQLLVSGKAITIRGQGAGGILGKSYETETLVSSGSITFSLSSDIHMFGRPYPNIEIGEELRLGFVPRPYRSYMIGTVTAYSWPSVTMTVTSGAQGDSGYPVGTGTTDTAENHWYLMRAPATKITTLTDHGEYQGLIEVTKDNDGSVILEDLKLTHIGSTDVLLMVYGSSGVTPIFRRVWFGVENQGSVGTCRLVSMEANGGVFSDCYFDQGFNYPIDSNNTRASSSAHAGVVIQFGSSTDASWTTTSTMGDADDGTNNTYWEDCFFAFVGTTTFDCSDNARATIRYCVMDSSTCGGHGQDTGTAGVRHVDFYKNVCLFRDDGSGRRTPGISAHFSQRGGTGVVTDCYIDDINSTSWGDNPQIRFRQFTLYDGRGIYGGWGSPYYDAGHVGGETVWPSAEYPCPRQIGFGYVDGSGNTDGTGGYQGDFEPYYVWNNTGDGTAISVQGTESGINGVTNPDQFSAYVRVDSDADGIVEGEIMVDEAKPGWAEYTYPHPLAGLAIGAAYNGRLRFDGTGSKPVLTDGTGSVPIKTD